MYGDPIYSNNIVGVPPPGQYGVPVPQPIPYMVPVPLPLPPTPSMETAPAPYEARARRTNLPEPCGICNLDTDFGAKIWSVIDVVCDVYIGSISIISSILLIIDVYRFLVVTEIVSSLGHVKGLSEWYCPDASLIKYGGILQFVAQLTYSVGSVMCLISIFQLNKKFLIVYPVTAGLSFVLTFIIFTWTLVKCQHLQCPIFFIILWIWIGYGVWMTRSFAKWITLNPQNRYESTAVLWSAL